MRYIYIVFISTLSLLACNNGKQADSGVAAMVPKAPATSKLNGEGTTALMNTVTKYYGLKNALVATKAARVDSAANDLTTSAEQLSATLRKDSANAGALVVYMDSIVNESKVINAIKDETCEKQRIAFEVISRNMYALLKKAELKNGHVYREYCPMAFNEKGAYWLSGESEILNPYFGKKMLECGEVTDSL